MSTTPTPTPVPDGSKEIRTRQKNVLDLESREFVPVIKIGQFTPVANMQEFVERLGNDSDSILKVVNEGLEEYAKGQLESDNSVPYQTLDEEGNPTAAGSNLLVFGNDDKEKAFGATILNIAKMAYEYPDIPRGATAKMSADEVKAMRAKKVAAKQQAVDFILSNPAAVEALKK
jgi:hypothetical protein